MKKLFIIANWKSNKTIEETEDWLHDFSEGFNEDKISLVGKKIIIAPSFTSLEHAHYCLRNLKLPIKFAGQDISPFEEGAYTGEVSARQIKEIAEYVIVGHSERRRNFGEDDEMVNQKLDQAFKHDLTPILCVSNMKQTQKSTLRLRSGQELKMMVAYEPLFAIGTGSPDNPENANSMGKKIKEILGEVPVLYGGSVTSDNVKSFTSMPQVNGVLVGGASLDPLELLKIIKNA